MENRKKNGKFSPKGLKVKNPTLQKGKGV